MILREEDSCQPHPPPPLAGGIMWVMLRRTQLWVLLRLFFLTPAPTRSILEWYVNFVLSLVVSIPLFLRQLRWEYAVVVGLLWFRGLTGMMMEDLWFFSALEMGRQRSRALGSCEFLSFPFSLLSVCDGSWYYNWWLFRLKFLYFLFARNEKAQLLSEESRIVSWF